MKQFVVPFLLFLFLVNLATAQQIKFSNAIEYNDYIVQQQLNIQSAMTAFNETVNNSEKPEINTARLKVVDESRTATKNIRNMPPFKGQTAFRDAAANLFEFYTKVTSTTYAEMIDLMFSEKADRSEKMEALVNKITADEKVYDDKFLAAQQAFAKAHNFKLE